MTLQKLERTIDHAIKGEFIDANDLREVFMNLLDNAYGEANDTSFGALFAALQSHDVSPELVRVLYDVVVQYDNTGERMHELNGQQRYGIVGSGKDTVKTFNISTCAAIVAASAGIDIVKNGSRSESSVTGATDIIESLGIPPGLRDDQAISYLDQHHFVYADAGVYFPKMSRRYVGKFLFFHPLSYLLSMASGVAFNNIVFGISDRNTQKVANLLDACDVNNYMVVCGEVGDGMIDEISTCGPTMITVRIHGTKKSYVLEPEEIGIERSQAQDIASGKTPDDNKRIALDILSGTGTIAQEDIVCVNAAAIMLLSGDAKDMKSGVQMARDLLRSGAAATKLAELQGAVYDT